MKVIIAGLSEESNSFSPIICTESYFRNYPPSAEGTEILVKNDHMPTEISGMIDVIRENGDQIVPVLDLQTLAEGPCAREVADLLIRKVSEAAKEHAPVDAIFLSLHGGMVLTDEGDGCGYILEQIRNHVGNDMVITASTDLHANVTKKMMDNANAITGYQTYPHEDFHETGARAARLGYRMLKKEKFAQICIRVPMMVPAEAYNTRDGKFADLINEAKQCIADGSILDFSIYMMQPWLNAPDVGSSVLVTAEDTDTAVKYARRFAHALFNLRRELTVKLWDVDDIIDIAEANETDMPVIIVDSADSPNAGASGDSSAVLKKLLKRSCTLKTALCVNDIPAVAKAFEIGVGGEGDFMLGGTIDHVFHSPCPVHAYVKSLHDGNFTIEGPAWRGKEQSSGKTAVLKVNNMDIVVFSHMQYTSDPQLYRAFGIEPCLYRLVQVKSATQYKVAYRKFSTLFYPADTPGASSANLVSMPFDRITHPFWPFDEIESFDDICLTAHK